MHEISYHNDKKIIYKGNVKNAQILFQKNYKKLCTHTKIINSGFALSQSQPLI